LLRKEDEREEKRGSRCKEKKRGRRKIRKRGKKREKKLFLSLPPLHDASPLLRASPLSPPLRGSGTLHRLYLSLSLSHLQ